MDQKQMLEILSVIIAIGAAVIAALKAAAANRAAKAAERSAEAAERSYLLSERKLGLDIAASKEHWVDRLGEAMLVHGMDKVERLLPLMPDELKDQWLEIIELASRHTTLTPERWEGKKKVWLPKWEKAVGK